MSTSGVVPRPRHQRALPGELVLDQSASLGVSAEAALPVAELLAEQLRGGSGWRWPITDDDAAPVRLELDESLAEPLGDEGYRLRIGSEGAVIRAATAAGLFYGTRTLLLSLPPAVLRHAPVNDTPWRVAATEVEDAPRFGWRGLHLDVARHFFPMEWLLRLVDLAALHKLNVLHLHLTDDQGWRVEIQKYPRLTEVAAWRRESSAGHHTEGRFDGVPHGGFYSQDDLRELVAYAARRFVTVLPEIDMPGHMQAAIAAYPELGSGRAPREVRTSWGISPHVLNMTERSVTFCTDVLDEVMGIFPNRYVHVGGDECPRDEWRDAPHVAELMAAHGIEDLDGVQSWFMGRVRDHLRANGRVMVGWDEIIEGGLAEGAVVMSWRDERGGTIAAAAGHDVVMAPQQSTYFDVANAHGTDEPLAIRAATDLAKVYGYEPIPADLAPEHHHHVLGAQGNLWTEYVATTGHAEYMYFPRTCALAEVLWSEGDQRDFGEFQGRLEGHLRYLDALRVNYRPIDGPPPGRWPAWSPTS